MPNRRRWALSAEQRQTIGFFAGLGSFIWWVATGADPNYWVAVLAAALLFGASAVSFPWGGRRDRDEDTSSPGVARRADEDDPDTRDRGVGRSDRTRSRLAFVR